MSAPTDAEKILMDLFEANREYKKFLDTLKDTPPLQWPDVRGLISLQANLKLLYDQACESGYTNTRRWRR